MRFSLFFRLLAAVLSLILLPIIVLGGSANAETIDNIARAHWAMEDGRYEQQSNLVSLTVDRSVPVIGIFRPGTGQGQAVTVRKPLCGNERTDGAALTDAEMIDLNLESTSVVRAGSSFLFEVTASSANISSSEVDRLEATIESSTGDREVLTIFETGANTGIFVGQLGTRRVPPPFKAGDCVLGVSDAGSVTIAISPANGSSILAKLEIDVESQPFGVVFDSETGELVTGARITLIDAVTGRPAQVFAEDGTTPWPSTVISGQTVTDISGDNYEFGPGEFWFPVTTPGSYRLLVEPPAPYTAPSAVPLQVLQQLRAADGSDFIVQAGSFGDAFRVDNPAIEPLDIPVDRPAASVSLTKTASRISAQPGDAVFYTVVVRNQDSSRPRREVTLVDTPSRWLRLREGSVHVDGVRADDAVEASPDGRVLTIRLGDIAAGLSRRVTYAMVVRPDAPAGIAENRVTARDALGRETVVGASVQIERQAIADRMTIIGRVTAGGCRSAEKLRGIPGVRVLLEDGSFALTDIDGRYHFEGVVPGTHVVQASSMTLPEGGEFVNCQNDTRNAGSPTSRFAIGQGGSLVVADFHAALPEGALVMAAEDATGLAPALELEGHLETPETDWLALGDGPDGWLTPAVDHNPRAPATRVVIRHRKGQKVALRVDDEPVNALTFEGTRNSEEGEYAVSLWRGVPLRKERTLLSADILNSFGGINQTIEREVFFTSIPARVEFLPDRSRLVADGRTRPVIAIRVLDRNNRPLRAGIAGEFQINEPYQSAEQLDRQQLNQLTGVAAGSARWSIDGSDGVALIELAPSMVSGSLRLDFRFQDGEIVRNQELETWIEPGEIEWTIVGLAEGSVGARTVADNMERVGRFHSDLGDEARVALYAKGRVLGKFLVTLAYDSAKQAEDQRVLGALDPDAYYTVFGDASSRRFDAASREKLYVRIETSTFYALYGDFVTGFDQTRLARYDRVATGIKAQARFGQIRAQGFAAEVATRFRRDEIQGQGISGPYRLSSRNIVANSEKIVLEVRDRFRSEVIVSRRELSRFLDYDVDLLSGTVRFREPLLSRDFDLNPQFVVISYEVDGFGDGELNAGARVEWANAADTLRFGGTAITDKGEGDRTNMGTIDLRARMGRSTELRAELAASHREGDLATGWLVEAQHRTGTLDVIAYALSLEEEYGVGQQNDVEIGRRKFGVDARVRVDERTTVLGSVWQDDSLATNARRRAAQVQIDHAGEQTDLRFGIAYFDDRLVGGDRKRSTVLEAGASQRFLDNRLELSASTSLPVDDTDAVDLPARHRIGARYALTDTVRAVGLYEIADGPNIYARTVKGGLEFSPWQGGQMVTSLGQQRIGELGQRSFAALGFAQTLTLTPELSIDATIDGNRTIGRNPQISDLVNPDHPAPSGGHLGQNGTLFEDFTAATLGAAWRKDRWSATARAEYRDGEYANRKGFTAGAIRQLGEGSIVGSGFTLTEARADSGATTEIVDAALALAHRPARSAFAFLSKLEYRSDEVIGALAGEAGPAGRTALAITGNARSRRLIASVSTNWSPRREQDARALDRRREFGLFIGARYNFDSFEGYDLSGTTMLAGLDARVGIGERFEIGARGTIRTDLSNGLTAFSVGPNVGFVPAENALLTVGYNIAGFRDEDFSQARDTDKGLYASVRMKFDADSFAFLGLGR